MKSCVFLMLVAMLATDGVCAAVMSSTNEGVFLVIGSQQPLNGGRIDEDSPLPFDRKFVWEPFSTIGPIELEYPDPEFGIRVKLIGSQGQEMPKTELGRKFGARFDSVHEIADATKGWHMGSIDAKTQYIERGRGFSGVEIPAPSDLFQMNEPGIYTLQIELLVFRVVTTGTNWNTRLLHFAPVAVKVQKPSTAADIAIYSKTNHGVCFAVVGTATISDKVFDNALNWQLCCTQHSLFHVLDMSSGIKLKLSTSNGRIVPKTLLGEAIGKYFDSIEKLHDLPTGVRMSEIDLRSGFPWRSTKQPLPSIKDCFIVQEHGVYNLEIQLQVFQTPYTFNAAGELRSGQEELVRFSSVNLRVNLP